MSSWRISALTTASSDTEPTFVLTFGTAKYIFNASEGMGRAWLQSHHTFRKTRGLFLTGAGNRQCGGIAGFLMLCADAALPSLDIVGPYGLTQYIATMRSYVYRSTMAVNVVETPSDPINDMSTFSPVYKDENITVHPIPLYTHKDECSLDEAPERHLKRKRSLSPPAAVKRLPPSEFMDASMSTSSPFSTLRDRARELEFSPSALIGQEAQEWRNLLIRQMFPAAKAAIVDKSLGKVSLQNKKRDKKAKGKDKEATEEASSEHPEPPARTTSPFLNRDKMYLRLPPLASGGPSEIGAPSSLGYLVVGPRVRGKFDVKKAEELGVPRGPIRARLTRGETVTFEVDDGHGGKVEKSVKSEECVGPSEMPQAILILDVPTPDYIPSLLASFTDTALSQYRSKSPHHRLENPVHVVYHICGDGVLDDERYKEFMNGFSDETHHVVSSRAHTPNKMTFQQTALVQGKLNQLDSEMFPMPKYDMTPQRTFSSVTGIPANTVSIEHNLFVQMRPPLPPVPDVAARPREFDSLAATGSLPVLQDSTKENFALVRDQVDERKTKDGLTKEPGDDLLITPLGTGSAIPTMTRNVSGTLIQIPGHGNILLDCGEGTWGQLTRAFGDDPTRTSGVWDVLRDLKCIFCSHMHGDHHMGLSKILTMRALMDPPPAHPLYVVAQRQHLLYLVERQEFEEHGLDKPNGVVMILSDALNWRFARPYGRGQNDDEPFMDAERSRELAKDLCKSLGLTSFTSVDVMHRTRCYGAVIRHQDGWGIAFSGDTMPTDNLVKAGRDVTLIIHEASMSPEQQELAQQKAHSTSSQAIDIGRRMGAKKILLTHFSARYPGMPPRRGANGDDGPVIGLAFDYARIRLGDMWKLNAYMPAIQVALSEFGDEEETEIDTTKLE